MFGGEGAKRTVSRLRFTPKLSTVIGGINLICGLILICI